MKSERKEKRIIKKNRFAIVFMSVLFASLMCVQVGAAARGYFNGCSDCGNRVIARCAGVVSVEEKSHKYNTFLGLFGNTCIYERHTHATTETCQVNSSHVHPGDNVIGYTGHTYDDLGKNACGEVNIIPCELGEFAYDSDK